MSSIARTARSRTAPKRVTSGQRAAAPTEAGVTPGGRPASARPATVDVENPLWLYRASPIQRIALVKSGIPATALSRLAGQMDMPKDRLASVLGLPRATINRKVSGSKPLSPDEGSRVMGMARLVGQVQAMVEESGQTEGFDAARWVARWLERPLPALDGRAPKELMDTAEGQALVSNLVARMQSGAYA